VSLLQRIRERVSGVRTAPSDPEALTELETRLERLDPEQARYVAAFAYVLARVAHADLDVHDSEVAEIRRRVATLAELSDFESGIVAEIAQQLATQLGGTENYTVTRSFRRIASHAQRIQLLECLHAVAAADGSILTSESGEISSITEELGLTRAELNSVRASWKSHLAALQGLPGKD
jgi:uncharacterized tellurite resistance protein B-like protein